MNRMLPDFIKPMLAETGEAFDSDQHLIEIKWRMRLWLQGFPVADITRCISETCRA